MIDLHTHSAVSDGSDPPARLPELAAAAGCRAMALTDHDRLDGIAAARASAERAGVELVAGCEVSCAWERGTMHLLAYYVEPGEGPLADELVRLQADRAERNRALVARLRALGLPISEEAVAAEAGGMGAGRPHVAAVLVKTGVVGSIQEAFDTYLGKGGVAYVSKARLDPSRAIELVRASGGLAVLAHPDTLRLGPAETRAAIGELAAMGLVGLEAHYGRYTPEHREELACLAQELGLVATGGSDYHGSYKPDLSVGTGTGDLDVPDSVLEALEAHLG
ncbi:MAG: PHP domain-containing protein [Acidimicrobiales bacterium]